MKILKLLEIIDTGVAQKQFHGYFKPRYNDKYREDGKHSPKELGHGHHSSVKRNPADPHLVKKHNIRPYGAGQRMDGFKLYIDYLIEHKLLDNVHFPRVYNIKELTDKAGQRVFTYDLEKLMPFEKLSREEILAFMEHSVFDKMREIWFDDDCTTHYMLEVVSAWLNEGVNDGDTSYFTDETLVSALKILYKIGKKINVSSDITMRNFMWRRTPYGVQIVFSEQFY